jgi:DNA-binding NarL/FixJ family response regulator
MSKRPYRILLVDDHQVILDGIEAYLKERDDAEVIDRALNAEECLNKIEHHKHLDLVILDVNLPDKDGIKLAEEIRSFNKELKILAYSLHRQVEFVKSIIGAGAKGYVLKTSGKMELLNAVEKIINGGNYLDTGLRDQLELRTAESGLWVHDKRDANVELTNREKEIVRLIAAGNNTDYISEKLFISTHTVNSHRKNILSKIDGKNAADITRHALKTGILARFDIR